MSSTADTWHSVAPTRSSWELHKATIMKLYVNENKNLQEVVDIMRNQYGFKASMSMYKKHLSRWGTRKNLKAIERKTMLRELLARSSQGKQTEIRLDGKVIDVRRYLRHRSNLDADDDGVMQLESNPHLDIRTPSPQASIDLPETLKVKETILRQVHIFAKMYLHNGWWISSYDSSFRVVSSHDQSEAVLSSIRRLFEFATQILHESKPHSVATGFQLLSSALNKMPVVMKSPSPILIPAIIEMYQNITPFPELLKEIQRYFEQLSSCLLGHSHQLRLVLREIAQLAPDTLSNSVVPIYDVLLDTIIPYIGPDNIYASRLYLGHIWHSSGIQNLVKGEMPPVVAKYMRNDHYNTPFISTKTAFALSFGTQLQLSVGEAGADAGLAHLLENHGLFQCLSDFSKAHSNLWMGLLSRVHIRDAEARQSFESALDIAQRWSWNINLIGCAQSYVDSTNISPQDRVASGSQEAERYSYNQRTEEYIVSSDQPDLLSGTMFTVVIFCKHKPEIDAMLDLMDVIYEHQQLETGFAKTAYNIGFFGELNSNRIVLLCGNSGALAFLTVRQHIFPNVRIALSIGICDAVPHDLDGRRMFIGDVVVGTGISGVDQFADISASREKGQQASYSNGTDINHSIVNLLNSDTKLRMQNEIFYCLSNLYDSNNDSYLTSTKDKSYSYKCPHAHHQSTRPCTCGQCEGQSSLPCTLLPLNTTGYLNCDDGIATHRSRTIGKKIYRIDPVLHVGKLGVGFPLPMTSDQRDHLCKTHDIIAFEMEVTELWETIPTIFIRAAADYADGCSDAKSQAYATIVAACTTNVLLRSSEFSGRLAKAKTDCLTQKDERISIASLTASNDLKSRTQVVSDVWIRSPIVFRAKYSVVPGLPTEHVEDPIEKSFTEPTYLSTLEDVAATYGQHGMYEEAKQILALVVELRTSKLGRHDPETISAVNLRYAVQSEC